MPPSAITGTPKRRAYSATLYTDVPWGRPHAITEGQERELVSRTRFSFIGVYFKPTVCLQDCTFQHTFLGDTDRATAHAHPQGIHPSVYEVFGLSSCHH